MLNAIIRFSLRQRLLIAAISVLLCIYGTWQIAQLPIDVFPDLNRPRVTILTEAHGMAPEEVETLVTRPIETALNGATGVQAVRSQSSPGFSVVWVEFDWGTDIYVDRQIVNERLALVSDSLSSEGVQPQMAPISSIMGQVMIVGMYSAGNETSPMDLRTLADWNVRQRLLTIPGVAQVTVMGGDLRQFQVLLNPDELLRLGVTIEEVRHAVSESNENATGGYLDEQGPKEILVRSLGRIKTIDDLKNVVVKIRKGHPVLLGDVANVTLGAATKRGSSSAYVREPGGEFVGGPAVVLTVNKQPDADTREVTERVTEAIRQLKLTFPEDIRINSSLYQQKFFIDRAIENVIEALQHGSILVVVILILFLMNFRTTIITLTAIPLSIVTTGLIFHIFGLSINTMTLGGLAVAIGELVDDAIVDVENIYRRLRENSKLDTPRPVITVVYEASIEVRNPIVTGTTIVILVFLPVFGLTGMEGRLFTPVGIAYTVSILASLLVSLTVTPVLSYWLLGKQNYSKESKESLLLRMLQKGAGWVIAFSLRLAYPIMLLSLLVVMISGVALYQLENDFLPPFNEGAWQVNVVAEPGTSLRESNKSAERVRQRLLEIEGLISLVRKTGRAELDEHAEGVNVSEFVLRFDPKSPRTRQETRDALEKALEEFRDVGTSVEQPLAHLMVHMLSGVKAQVGIKLYGDNLDILRDRATKIQSAIADIPGVTDLQIEPQINIPQLIITPNDEALQAHGLRRHDINRLVEIGLQGEVISQVLNEERTFDLVVRLDESFRENPEAVERLTIDLPEGGKIPLGDVADIKIGTGPNTIKRERVRRRILVQCNTTGRGQVDVVNDIRAALKKIEDDLPVGYNISYEGQFESQASASRVIGGLFTLSLFGVFLVLHMMFRSTNLALQVMIALPMAFIGSVAALWITGQTLTVAGMIGFISLCGIASRNGILLLNHYLHLVREEGESWSKEMIVRAGKERLAPVLMTALTSGIGLVPLAMAAGEPGKEILYPVATVIIGGLITSTILEFLVRPALFWKFGLAAAQRSVERDLEEDDL